MHRKQAGGASKSRTNEVLEDIEGQNANGTVSDIYKYEILLVTVYKFNFFLQSARCSKTILNCSYTNTKCKDGTLNYKNLRY